MPHAKYLLNLIRSWLIPTLIALIFLRVWTGPAPILPEAQAQLPDSGLQRKHLLEETRKTNELLEHIILILDGRGVKLRTATTDNSSDTGSRAASK